MNMNELNTIRENALNRFRNFGYGLFIHYGVYSIAGRGEWLMSRERMTAEEYFSVLNQFNNNPKIADDWVETAVKSGMKYIVLTTRHHDGYLIGKELIKHFCDKCRENNLGIGLYHSVGDWTDMNFRNGPSGGKWHDFVKRNRERELELVTEYGKIDYIFYDGCPRPETWNCKELNDELRSIQPHLLISSRCGVEEDVSSSEQNARAHQGVWESCFTMNNSWGHVPYDKEWKTPLRLEKLLMNIRHNGGNFLLNVGPDANGLIGNTEKSILAEISNWLKINHEAVFGVEPHPFNYHDQEISVGRGENIYISLNKDWDTPERVICGIGNKVKKIQLLGDDTEIKFTQDEEHLRLKLPSRKNADTLRILKLVIEGKPFGVPNNMWPKDNFRVC